MGRKKTEFTKEQDERITQLVNEGHSLNEILVAINDEFETNFSRSGIDRRIKALGIVRNKINKSVLLSRSDMIKYVINKQYYNTSRDYKKRCLSSQYTLDAYSKRMKISKPTLLRYIKKYNLPSKITPDMKEYFEISNLDLRMYKEGTVNAIIKQLTSKTDVVIERDAVIRIGNTDIKVELYFPEHSAVLVAGMQDDYYTKELGKSDLPIVHKAE